MTVSVRSQMNPPLIGFLATQEFVTDTNDRAITGMEPPPYKLGTKVETTSGYVYRFVKATAAKTQYIAYLIDETWTVGAALSKSNDDNMAVGIPMLQSSTAPASLHASGIYTYFWIQTGGTFTVTPDNTVADAGDVKTTGNAGYLDDGDDSGLAIIGAQWTSGVSSGAGTATFWLSDEMHVNT